MSIHFSLLPPSNRPNDHSHDGHFSFTYTLELELRSPNEDKITDNPGPSPPYFPAGPLHDLHRRPGPSSPSWTAVAELLSSLKKFLSLEHNTILWCPKRHAQNPSWTQLEERCPKRVVQNPSWTQLDGEESLITHVLEGAAREAEGKNPSYLCLKIRKVVEVSVRGFMLKSIKVKMKPFRSDNGMYENFSGLFSDDGDEVWENWCRLCEEMARVFGVVAPDDEEGVDWVLERVREWERQERVREWERELKRVESREEDEEEEEEEKERCSICLESGGRKCRLPCAHPNHTFHSKCILMWMRVKRHCPLCRNKL